MYRYGKELTMMNYEEAITKLEETVKQLESGKLSLEESIAMFEQGTKLAKECYQTLKTAEQKITLISELEEQEEDLDG